MNNSEAYNHGYNGTLTLDELMALFPPCGLRDEEQDAEYDAESDATECDMEPDDFMTDAEADADALASAGWGMDEDYGSACDMF